MNGAQGRMKFVWNKFTTALSAVARRVNHDVIHNQTGTVLPPRDFKSLASTFYLFLIFLKLF
jgi:hypothetical protein